MTKSRVFLAAQIAKYVAYIGLGLVLMWMGAEPYRSGLVAWLS